MAEKLCNLDKVTFTREGGTPVRLSKYGTLVTLAAHGVGKLVTPNERIGEPIIVSNLGPDLPRWVKQEFGLVLRLGPVRRDLYGRTSQVGSAEVHYDLSGKIDNIGGYQVHYDLSGRIDSIGGEDVRSYEGLNELCWNTRCPRCGDSRGFLMGWGTRQCRSCGSWGH